MSSGVADQANDGSKRAGRATWAGVTRLGDPLTTEILTLLVALTAAGVAVAVNVAPAPALTIAVLAPAALVDVREQRLPDHWVLAAASVFVAAGATATLVGDPPAVTSVGAGALAMAGPLLVLHLASPDAMGFGDVKAAIVLGAALGVVDWHLGLVALSIAAALASIVGLARRRDTIAFGPFLVAAATLTLLASGPTLPRLTIGAGG
jgi:leader peptidase (prepilin peptidase)/N-methyltransferase